MECHGKPFKIMFSSDKFVKRYVVHTPNVSWLYGDTSHVCGYVFLYESYVCLHVYIILQTQGVPERIYPYSSGWPESKTYTVSYPSYPVLGKGGAVIPAPRWGRPESPSTPRKDDV